MNGYATTKRHSEGFQKGLGFLAACAVGAALIFTSAPNVTVLAEESTAPTIVDGDIASYHVTEGETDTQYINLSLTFSEPVKITDSTALAGEMTFTLGGTAIPAASILSTELSEDEKTLSYNINMGFAAYSGLFVAAANNTVVVAKDDSTPAVFDYKMFMPNGLTTKITAQNFATEETPASVSTEILRPDDCTRGMVHWVLLKNGVPVEPLNSYGANAVSHFHNYLTMTAAEIAASTATALQKALGEAYTVTQDGAMITVTAAQSEPGDVLELHIMSYLNNGTKIVDKAEFLSELAAAEALDSTLYTEDSMTALTEVLKLISSAKDSVYYSQADINEKLAALETAMAGLELIDNGSEEPVDSEESKEPVDSEESKEPVDSEESEEPVDSEESTDLGSTNNTDAEDTDGLDGTQKNDTVATDSDTASTKTGAASGLATGAVLITTALAAMAVAKKRR